MEHFVNDFRNEKPEKITNFNRTGKILLGITGGVALSLTVICAPFLTPALRKFCLPYIPATHEQMRNIFLALKNREGNLLDIGSGDGRIVFDAAKKGFVSYGVELNPWLVLYSKYKAYKLGQKEQTKFIRCNLWNFDLAPFNNIVIFGVEQMMPALQDKVLKECQPNCNVIACRFPLPNLTPDITIGSGINTVWVYKL